MTCPRCGFDFHPPGSESPTDGPVDNNLDNPQDAVPFDDGELQKVKELVSAPSKELAGGPRMKGKRTLRPNLYDNKDGAATKGCSPEDEQALETLTRTARKIQEGILRAKEGSPQALLESRCRGRWYDWELPGQLDCVFKAVGVIMYDQEWTGRPYQETSIPAADYKICALKLRFASAYVFELMLLVDYGLPPSPIPVPWPFSRAYFQEKLRRLESSSAFLAATACLWKKAFSNHKLEAWDAAILLYWYHTRRKPVDEERRKEGWTGYTGVLQEMIDEVATHGTDRLARKLSLDINMLIPKCKCIWDRKKREKMLFSARALADQYGLSVEPPEETTKDTGRGWLEAVTGWFSSGTRDEHPEEKEHLIQV